MAIGREAITDENGGMNRILVIGAKGMLGRDLVQVLRSSFSFDPHSNWEVLGWDIDEMDIREEKKTVTMIENLKPKIVINVAAFTDVDGCESEKEKAFVINAEGMKHVALGALRCRAKVLYLSTDYVFDGGKGKPYVEDDPPNPLNVYGQSKLQGERYVQELVEDGLIIRTQWLYGKYGKNFVASILLKARENKTLSIVNDQIGSPTYTVDLSKAISALIQRDARGVFHVTNSGICTWFKFGQTILEMFGMEGVKVMPIASTELNLPAARPLYSVLHCQKLKQGIGITMRPWSEALKDFLSTFQS
jgi:dTDP-4-dehydrorhamnose reductase